MTQENPKISNWEQVSQTESVPEKPEKRGGNNTLTILLALFLGVLLIGGGILAYIFLVNREETGMEENQTTSGATKNESSQSGEKNQTTTSGGLNNLIEETAGWAFCENLNLNIFIKYSSTWNCEVSDYSIVLRSREGRKLELTNSYSFSPQEIDTTNREKISEIKTTSNTYEIYYYSQRTSLPKILEQIFNKNNILYLVGTELNNLTNEEKEEINQILSTFKFLESADTVSEKTCESSDLKLSFTVPSDWTCVESERTLTLTSDLFTVRISDFGRGPCCESYAFPGDPEPIDTCETTDFYVNSQMSLQACSTNGELGEIFGIISKDSEGNTIPVADYGSKWTSITYTDMATKILSESEKTELTNVLKYVKIIE